MFIPLDADAKFHTEDFHALIPVNLASEFRSAVLERHGTLYDRMGLEVARALKAHINTMRLEARTAQGSAQPVGKKQPEGDPFMNCLHADLEEEDPSSEPDLEVL